MKYLITVCLVSAMLMGSAYADDTQTQNQQGNVEGHQTTVVKGPGYSESTAQGGEAAAGAYSGIYWDWNYNPTSIMRYPEYRVPPVSPGQAQLPWPYPTQPWFWNSWPNGLAPIFQRQWTLGEVDSALKHIGYRGPLGFLPWGLFSKSPETGKGFKWQVSLHDYQPRPESKPKFTTLTNDVNMPALLKKYAWIGAINLKGEEDLTIDQAVRCAVRLAFRYDLDLGILVPGMNPVNNAVGVSSGVGYTTAGVTNNLSLIGSVSGGKAVVRAEPGVTLYVFRENGIPKPSPSEGTSEKAVEPVKEKEIPGVKISPELQELYKKGEVNGGIRGAELEQMRSIQWKRAAGN